MELFFVISGFYMAMVLSGRYRTVGDFYRSRWLRIAVPYYWHLVAIVSLSVVAGLFFSEWLALSSWANDPLSRNGAVGLFFVGLTNLTIFGQDAVLFLRDNSGSGLRFTGCFGAFPDPLYTYLVMPQCWSVAVELVFYALVPFLNRFRTLPLFVVFLASVFVRLAAYRFAGLDHDPWIYRFIPFELAFFIAGMLGWRALQHWKPHFDRARTPSWPAYLGICALIVLAGFFFRTAYNAGWYNPGEAYAGFFLCLASTPLIVLAFLATSGHQLDRLIGELSYPIYLNHLFFIVAIRAMGETPFLTQWSGVIAGAASIASAWIFWHLVLRRFEEQRHRLFGLRAI